MGSFLCTTALGLLFAAITIFVSASPTQARDADHPVKLEGYSSNRVEVKAGGAIRERREERIQVKDLFLSPENDYVVKFAYGTTFGTCTKLDYTTLELAKRGRRFPTGTSLGQAVMETQVALIASHVFYWQGEVERLRRLDFQNGYELGWVPKGRFTLVSGPLGLASYFESGAGIGYVSETYRNSGSRWNWSLLAGFGVERLFPRQTLVSVGLQWRHLSNGNMWGKGDELHNSNSGTDMIQGSAMVVHRF